MTRLGAGAIGGCFSVRGSRAVCVKNIELRSGPAFYVSIRNSQLSSHAIDWPKNFRRPPARNHCLSKTPPNDHFVFPNRLIVLDFVALAWRTD